MMMRNDRSRERSLCFLITCQRLPVAYRRTQNDVRCARARPTAPNIDMNYDRWLWLWIAFFAPVEALQNQELIKVISFVSSVFSVTANVPAV